MKRTKNWSKKRKAFTAVSVIVLAALLGTVLYSMFRPEELPAYQVATVEMGDIQSTFQTQGTVESGNTETFTAASGVQVLTVSVEVGDRVSAGQQLATFDVSTLQDELTAYKSAYDKAKATYDEAAASVAAAENNLSTVSAQIPTLESEIAQLESEIEAAEHTGGMLPDSGSIDTAALEQLLAALREQGGFTEEQLTSLSELLSSGSNASAIKDSIENSVAAKRVELAQKQAQLTSLETQQTVYKAQTDDTLATLYKSVMDAKKADYDSFNSLVESLRTGWVAAADGIVTEVNLTAGEVFTPAESKSGTTDLSALLSMASGNTDVMSALSDLLSATGGADTSVGTGIVVEEYGALYVSFTVGKYDLPKLDVGQAATVTSLDKEYAATVSYVSATATASSGLDISSITSSLTGGGAASTTNSAPVQVRIMEPDESVVIGFDVDVSINTERLENVLVLPVAAVTTEDGENYVFVYDPEERTVSKRSVTLGLASDDAYQVLDGLSDGEQVVLNPKAALLDGDKISVES